LRRNLRGWEMDLESINLKQLDLKMLKELRGRVDKAIASFEENRRRGALEAVRATAQELGFTLHELLPDGPRERSKAEPKFRHPSDHEVTWSGRGRKPKWVEDHLVAGKALDDLKIR